MRRRILCGVIGWFAVIGPAFGQMSPLDQPVSVKATDSSVLQVLTNLTATYQLRFSYAPDLLPLQRKVSLQAEQQPLRVVLDKLFGGSGIRYQIIGSQVVLQAVPALSMAVAAQTGPPTSATVSGYVTDAATGEALPGAAVLVAGRPELSVSTNTYGFYSLRLPAGDLPLQVRYLGYAPLDTLLRLPQGGTLRAALRLRPLAQALNGVEVLASKATELDQVNRLSLRASELKQLPRLMGEADAVKAIQLLPGVQDGREGSSDLIVRGGGPDQNLVLLDGVPVYNIGHLLGLFSVFNPDAIKNVDVLKGGFRRWSIFSLRKATTRNSPARGPWG